MAGHRPEAPVAEGPRQLPQVNPSEAIALARESQHRVRPCLDVAVDRPREVDAQERERGVGHGVDQAAHEIVPLRPDHVVLAPERA